MCHFTQIPPETAFTIGHAVYLKIAPVKMLIDWYQPPIKTTTKDGKEIKIVPPIEPSFAVYNAIHKYSLYIHISPD